MAFSNGLVFIGALMTLIGVYMVYLSLRASPNEMESKHMGVIFIGPIPLIFAGTRKWIITAVCVAAVVMLFIATRSISPELIGW